MYSLYSILLFVALVVSAPWWVREMLRHGKYRTGLGERLGRVPERVSNQVATNTIWVHAVSVGEVLAISRVIDELKDAAAWLARYRLDHNRYWTETGARALRREQRVLFPGGSAFCDTRVFAGVASEVASAGGE